VHGNHYIGVRAGIGVAQSFGTFRDLVNEPGAPGQVVREKSGETDFALPLLLTLYPGGRDALEMPQSFSWGPVAGLDVTKVSSTPRLYGGLVFDFYGFGLTFLGSAERTTYVEDPKDTVINPASAAQIDHKWRGGMSFAVTTDLDIFQAIFQSYFKSPSLPSVTEAGPK
jgi:hypothetical protein